jgi:hypothetical protein
MRPKADYRWSCRDAFSFREAWSNLATCWRPSWSNGRTGTALQQQRTTPQSPRNRRTAGSTYHQAGPTEQPRCPWKISLLLRPCYGGRDYAYAVAFASLVGACPLTGESCEAHIACVRDRASDVQGLSPFRKRSRPQLEKPCRREVPPKWIEGWQLASRAAIAGAAALYVCVCYLLVGAASCLHLLRPISLFYNHQQ